MIGKKLKQARKQKNMTLKDLEIITGLSNSNISNYENEKVSPTANAIILLCNALDISADWLLLDRQPTNYKKESELIELYQQLSEDNKVIGRYKLKELLKEQESEKGYTKAGNL